MNGLHIKAHNFSVFSQIHHVERLIVKCARNNDKQVRIDHKLLSSRDLVPDAPGPYSNTLAPKLEMNLATQEWERWRSSWARHNCYTGLTDSRDCVYSLWGCFSQKVEMGASGDRLGDNADLNKDEEQFLERVRRLAVSGVSTSAWSAG